MTHKQNWIRCVYHNLQANIRLIKNFSFFTNLVQLLAISVKALCSFAKNSTIFIWIKTELFIGIKTDSEF